MPLPPHQPTLPATHPPPAARRRLIQGAFPGTLPDYLTSPEFYKFAPAEDFVSLPGRDTQRTHFRLVVTLPGGWEHGVVDRELSFGGGGGGRDSAPRDLLVTVRLRGARGERRTGWAVLGIPPRKAQPSRLEGGLGVLKGVP